MSKNNILFEVSEIELVYKNTVKAKDRPVVTKSSDAYNILLSLWNMDTIELREDFKILLVNRRNHVIGAIHLSQGGLAGTVADVRHIFASALKANASGIIMAHNHPSGEKSASQQDISLTKRCAEIGRLLEIPVLDHIILTLDGYLSMSDSGHM